MSEDIQGLNTYPGSRIDILMSELHREAESALFLAKERRRLQRENAHLTIRVLDLEAEVENLKARLK